MLMAMWCRQVRSRYEAALPCVVVHVPFGKRVADLKLADGTTSVRQPDPKMCGWAYAMSMMSAGIVMLPYRNSMCSRAFAARRDIPARVRSNRNSDTSIGGFFSLVLRVRSAPVASIGNSSNA